MPNLNLGAGVPQHVNLTYTPTWLFTPVSSIANNVRLYNEGQNTVYVGQADVTTLTGLPISPGSKPVLLTNVTSSLYAISSVTQGALLGTVTTASTAGQTTAIFYTGAVALLPPGTQFMIGSTFGTSNQEVVNVSTSVGTSTVSTSTAMKFYHSTTDNVWAVTPTYGQLSVNGGII